MLFQKDLKKIILSRHQGLALKLAQTLTEKELIKASKEYASLEGIIGKINNYEVANSELQGLKEILIKEADIDLRQLIEDEISVMDKRLVDLEQQIKSALLSKDEADEKNAIIEVRAGTGGEEAALFAASLFGMYQRYAEIKRWKFEILSLSSTGIGGYKEAIALISGIGVFSRLKYESGVHRVQRVPKTESSGRIHTSAATVAVLPEAQEVDIKIEEKDIRIDTYRASGAGGQHVNTTDSAVRITHIPSGLIVTQQDEKSQHKNKAKAFKILRSRLYDLERQKADEMRASSRRGQVGSGDRSERIRTYNYPQGRVTDHRIDLTLYKIDEIVAQGDLDELIKHLINAADKEELEEVIEQLINAVAQEDLDE